MSARSASIFSCNARLLDELRPQAQARQRGLQVMGDGGEHLGAIVDEAPEAQLHLVEGARRRAHLRRAALLQHRYVALDAQALRRGTQALDGGA